MLTRWDVNPYIRWGRLVADTVRCRDDPRTVGSWSAHFGISESTLRARCRAVGVAAIAARDFSRVLRVVVRSQDGDRRWDPAAHLGAADPRTIRRLLVTAGLADLPDGVAAPPVECFFGRQRFVHERAVAAVRTAMVQERGEGRRSAVSCPGDSAGTEEKP